MKRIIAIAICLLLFISIDSTASEVEQGVQSIKKRSIEAQIRFLSSDSLRGRRVGSGEAAITAEYIESTMYGYGYDVARQNFYMDSVKSKKGSLAIGQMTNLLFGIQGTDGSQTVIVGAHYDHLGVDKTGEIYNGADDNASGVVAVLQIARAFKEAGITPRHNIIFAFWDGEEFGSLGSKYFVTNAMSDSLDIASYMNFDMIGRNTEQSNPTMFRYLYTASMPNFERWLRLAISTHSLNLAPDFKAWDNPTTGSDNAPFARVGVPIVWFHTDGHPDYHRTTDTYDKLNYTKMVDIIRAAFVVVVEMSK